MAPPTKHMLAVVTTGGGNIELKEMPVPKPNPDEILVKVVAAAANPTDWKSVFAVPSVGNIVGCDFSGTVAEIGPKVTYGDLKLGDRVAGFVYGAAYPNGAFAEYTAANPITTVKLPDWWSFEEAPQIGIAGYTACMCLWDKLPLPNPLEPAKEPINVLVWGGATSVGLHTIQFAKASNLRVITTCSPKNFEHVKSFGADYVFSYQDPQTPEKIRELTGNKLKYAVDCVCEGDTPAQIARAISEEGGDVSIILPYETVRPQVRVHFLLVYNLFGKECKTPFQTPAMPEEVEFAKKATEIITYCMLNRKLRPPPIRVLPNGLDSVREGSFHLLRTKKVSGEKLIYRIADTPQIKAREKGAGSH